ncbi:MAG: hypothetical protein WKF34_00970 [Pyrinomonadaceae bacterium]
MLKNSLPELALFFDLEWVPDAASSRRLFDLAEDVTEIEAMGKLWESSRQYDIATNPRPFLKYMFSRVVSIAYLSRKSVYRDGERITEFTLNSLPELPLGEDEVVDEAAIIERFLYILGRKCPQLVGYNSADSDMQVLIQRGMIHEISAPEFCKRPDKPWEGSDYFRRWDNEDHLDMMKLFKVPQMTPRLDEFAKVLGLPGKIDVKGDQVTDLWLNREVTKIVEYNQIDVLNTYLVWLRLVHFCGKMAEEEYVMEQDLFRDFLENEAEKPAGGFIAQFLAKWPQ